MDFINKLISSFGHAFRGIRSGFKSEQNLRIEALAFLIMLFSAWYFQFNYIELTICLVVSIIVFAAEFFNTAIEFLSNRVSEEFHPYIKIAKDCAAAGVLIASIGSIIVWGIIVWQKI